MSDIEIFGIEIENVEIWVLLTLTGWAILFFLFKYWIAHSNPAVEHQLIMYGVICAIVTPIITWLLTKPDVVDRINIGGR